MLIGYARVSKADGSQSLDLQHDALRAAGVERDNRHCCKVSDEAAFCLIQRPYISKTLLTRRISPRGSP
ncbi:recombinase family protein [Klebsiella aerogenes]|uniref:recombinase family protein n=1 Tax=Klebsiella aerogenes TaxID=548 RepID=UPI003CD040BB